jgi:hypothetical protein
MSDVYLEAPEVEVTAASAQTVMISREDGPNVLPFGVAGHTESSHGEVRFSHEFRSVQGMELKRPLLVTITIQDGHYRIYSEEIDVQEGGSSMKQALENFMDFVVTDARHWQTADDAQLSAAARTLKATYQELIELPSE